MIMGKTVYLSDDELAQVRVALQANKKGLGKSKTRDRINNILEKIR